jgi:AraC-like DNA-binding protein
MVAAACGRDGGSTLRLAHGDIRGHDRAAGWRELYGAQILRREVEPLADVRLTPALELQMLPGRGVVAGGDDALTLQISRVPAIAARPGGHLASGAGDALVLASGDVKNLPFPSASAAVALRLRRSALRTLLPNVDAIVARPVPHSTPALRPLLRYLRVLQESRPPRDPEVERVAVMHVYDLLAFAFRPARDRAEDAREGDMCAAMLQAVKAEMLENLHRGDLSVHEVAARYGLKPRNLQRLFEREDTTFTDFVLSQRLMQAHRTLSHADCTRTITSVALGAGFNDLSYFNRSFRRQFGCTPSKVRAGARAHRTGKM